MILTIITAAAAAKLLQSCPTLCDPIDGSLPGFPIPGILQVRILEWVAISFLNAWKWKVKEKSVSCVWLLATPWTAAYQAMPQPVTLKKARVLEWVPLHSNRCEVISHCGMICISLMINSVYHLFLYLLITYISSLENDYSDIVVCCCCLDAQLCPSLLWPHGL